MKLLCILAVLLLAGCATLSPEECKQADWYQIGMTDAQQGYAKVRMDEHRKACAKVQITPDLARYQRGHEKGQKTYCTTQNGFAEGAKGASYQGACEGYLAEDFLRGYHDGQELYQARSRLEQINRDIDRYNDEIWQLQRQIDEKQRQMADEPNTDRRRDLYSQLQDVQRDLRYTRDNLHSVQREREPAEHNLYKVQNRMRNYGY